MLFCAVSGYLLREEVARCSCYARLPNARKFECHALAIHAISKPHTTTPPHHTAKSIFGHYCHYFYCLLHWQHTIDCHFATLPFCCYYHQSTLQRTLYTTHHIPPPPYRHPHHHLPIRLPERGDPIIHLEGMPAYSTRCLSHLPTPTGIPIGYLTI